MTKTLFYFTEKRKASDVEAAEIEAFGKAGEARFTVSALSGENEPTYTNVKVDYVAGRHDLASFTDADPQVLSLADLDFATVEHGQSFPVEGGTVTANISANVLTFTFSSNDAD